jgi:exopolysaccharide biosynthesis polyprenyl glycosylphosphotransferase
MMQSALTSVAQGTPVSESPGDDAFPTATVSNISATRVRSIQQSWTRVRIGLTVLSDIYAVVLATSLAVSVRLGNRPLQERVVQASGTFSLTYAHLSIFFILSWICVVFAHGGYSARRLSSLWEQSAKLWRTAVTTLATLGVGGLFLRTQISRSYVLILLSASVAGSFVGRAAIGLLFNVLQRVGIGVDRIVLIGPAASTLPIRCQLETTSARRTRVVDEIRATSPATLSALVIRSVNRHGATSVVMCGSASLPVGSVRALASHLNGSGVTVVIAPGTAEAIGPGVQLHAVGDLFLLRVRDSEPGGLERILKVMFDRVVAAAMLVVLSPLLFLLALMIRRDSPGAVLFRQERIGKNGQPFKIFKFRSMTNDAEARLRADGLWNAYVANGYKLPAGQDPRITRLGAVMRRTSLDELPQLINVICGQMSLVGPRPVVPKELEQYGDLRTAYTGVRPGVTGYWQVNGRSDVGFPERADLDAYYYDNRSFRVDLRILFRTVAAVAMRVGAH